MQFDLDLLTQDWLPNIWVAKSNPIGWTASTPEQDRWFGSIDELEKHYNPTNFGHHIVIRNVGGSIRLSPYLKKVIIDNPRRNLEFTADRYSVDMVSHSYGAIRASVRAGKLLGKGIIASIRKCPSTCNCLNNYKKLSDTDFKKMFLA